MLSCWSISLGGGITQSIPLHELCARAQRVLHELIEEILELESHEFRRNVGAKLRSRLHNCIKGRVQEIGDAVAALLCGHRSVHRAFESVVAYYLQPEGVPLSKVRWDEMGFLRPPTLTNNFVLVVGKSKHVNLQRKRHLEVHLNRIYRKLTCGSLG